MRSVIPLGVLVVGVVLGFLLAALSGLLVMQYAVLTSQPYEPRFERIDVCGGKPRT